MQIKFFTKGKSEFQKILVRLYEGKMVDATTSTEIPVKKEHWNSKKNELINSPDVVNYNLITGKLSEIKSALYNNYQKDFVLGVDINAEWVKKTVFNVLNRPENEVKKDFSDKEMYFYDWAVNWTKTAVGEFIKPRGSIFNEKDEIKYNLPLTNFKYFEKYCKKRFKFSDLDKSLKVKFKNFMFNEMQFSDKTISDQLSAFNYVIKRCEESGKAHHNMKSWKDFTNKIDKRLLEKTYDSVFLTENEINRIYNLKIDDKRLDATRDYFIIGLRTGMRVSDYLVKLKTNMLQKGYVNLRTTKTGKEIRVPLHPQVKEIIYKWKGIPPKRGINAQTFNKDIKDISQLAKINVNLEGGVVQKGVEIWDGSTKTRKVYGTYPKYELITSHTARRSFATNLKLLDFDNKTIMELGGWDTEEQMLHYIKMNGHAASKKLSEEWNAPVQPLDLNKLK